MARQNRQLYTGGFLISVPCYGCWWNLNIHVKCLHVSGYSHKRSSANNTHRSSRYSRCAMISPQTKATLLPCIWGLYMRIPMLWHHWIRHATFQISKCLIPWDNETLEYVKNVSVWHELYTITTCHKDAPCKARAFTFKTSAIVIIVSIVNVCNTTT